MLTVHYDCMGKRAYTKGLQAPWSTCVYTVGTLDAEADSSLLEEFCHTLDSEEGSGNMLLALIKLPPCPLALIMDVPSCLKLMRHLCALAATLHACLMPHHQTQQLSWF